MDYRLEIWVIWWESWRQHIRKAKEYAGHDGYCRAAMISQMEYVTARALRIMETI